MPCWLTTRAPLCPVKDHATCFNTISLENLKKAIYSYTVNKTWYYYESLWLASALKAQSLTWPMRRPKKLELVSPFGDNAVHDWHFVFGKLHLLQYDTAIGVVIKFTGCLIAT